MTPAELSRRLAERMEPLGSWPEMSNRLKQMAEDSPLGWWWYSIDKGWLFKSHRSPEVFSLVVDELMKRGVIVWFGKTTEGYGLRIMLDAGDSKSGQGEAKEDAAALALLKAMEGGDAK